MFGSGSIPLAGGAMTDGAVFYIYLFAFHNPSFTKAVGFSRKDENTQQQKNRLRKLSDQCRTFQARIPWLVTTSSTMQEFPGFCIAVRRGERDAQTL